MCKHCEPDACAGHGAVCGLGPQGPGALRGSIVRQGLTESVPASLIGGAAGLAIAYALSHAMLLLAFPHARNMPIEASPSLLVLGFGLMVSLLTGVVFGTAPAWLSSHVQPADALRGDEPGQCTRRRPLVVAAAGAGDAASSFVGGAAGKGRF